MTRFVFLADTHFGADPIGYHQQPAYPERLPELLALLDEWIRQHGGVDFVLHGGDLIDGGAARWAPEARRLFRQLSVPAYLCLGNHDVRERDALDVWLAQASEFFVGGAPNFVIAARDCLVHIVPTQWTDIPYYWERRPDPHFLPSQLEALDAAIATASAARPGALQILCTHCDTIAVPPEQTGFDAPYHAPKEAFAAAIDALLQRHPQVRCVLSAHNHINAHEARGGVHLVTASGFAETPFEFKLIEADAGALRMTTVALAPRVSFNAEYDYNKTFVQGRLKDRSFGELRG